MAESFDQWAILELMGHVRTAGRVTEEEHFGSKLGRIDVPQVDGTFFTQYFTGSSIYRMTITTEATARQVAGSNHSHPVQPWDLRLPAPATVDNDLFDEEDSED